MIRFSITAWQSWFMCNRHCLLSVHHLLRQWYTAFTHVILNFGILHLWLYYQLVDCELPRNFLFFVLALMKIVVSTIETVASF